MTKVMNRADRIHQRRAGALARIDNGKRREDTKARRNATADEVLALRRSTAKPPLITHTRKKLSDPNCSEARKAQRRGKIAR